jgi:hypothetical protein
MLAGVVALKAPVQESTVYIETAKPVSSYANSGVEEGTHAGTITGFEVGFPPQPAASRTSKLKAADRK